MKRKILRYSLFVLLLAAGASVGAQTANIVKKDLLREGNRMYKRGEYPQADSLYAAAVVVDTTYTPGWYDLGNSLYLGGSKEEAKAAWTRSLLNTSKTDKRTDIFYNLGGVEMDRKNYAEAIKLYKDALRENPSDEQARYNLALAQQLLKDQQQNQDDQQDKNDQNKDDQQDKNDQNKDDQNKDDQQDKNDQNKDDQQDKNDQNKDDQQDKNDQNKDDQQDKNDQNKDNQQDQDDRNKNQNNPSGGNSGQNQPQPLSQSDEQMLRAIDRQEQGTQEKVKAKKAEEGAVIYTTKDW